MKKSVKKPARGSTKVGDWYDYPQYYDMAFAEDTKIEADFFEAVAQKYAISPLRRMLEPGCGGGRLVVEMASRVFRSWRRTSLQEFGLGLTVAMLIVAVA